MGRLEKYNDLNSKSMSRIKKNQDMYKDVYLNNTIVDINNINEYMEDDVKNEEVIDTPRVYVPKNYDLDDYILNAKNRKVEDNLTRSLDNTDCEVEKVKEKKDEISQIISNIEEKEKELDFYSDLLPDDNDDTIVSEPVNETKLDNFLNDDMLSEISQKEIEVEEEQNKDFVDLENEEIVESEKKKKNSLPLVIFIILFCILIGVVVYIYFFK